MNSDIPSRKKNGLKQVLKLCWAVAQCLRFYSRLPIPPLPGEETPYAAPDFDEMPRALPFAGALLGLGGAFVLCLSIWLHFGALVAAGLSIAAMTFMTGAFHEDGLADTSDGFGGGATIERRLVIMKDSLIGSFGASALALAFFLRIAALGEITAHSILFGSVIIIIAAFLSRLSALSVLVALPSARTDGLSKTMGKTSWSNYLAGLAIAWLLTVLLGSLAGLTVLSICLILTLPLLSTYLMIRFSQRMIGGQTGDVAGAAQQIGEIVIYLSLLGGMG